ncbi:hypothetical protein L1887_59374 [Cichorium endivia]|nr:hypothetical protein L1887_59374 [Cichorium endivia]
MAARTTHPSHGLGQRHVPLGAEAPTAGRQTGAGTRVASSPDSDLEAFSHNPAHGRADIEGSKSNVAMNAWLPQASYPCGNFSDTSSFKFRRCAAQPNSPPDNVFRPDRPAEAGLGSKKRGHCPASDSRNNRIPLVRTSSELAVRRPGKAPEGAVPSSVPRPARGDPLSPRKQLEQSADSRRVRDWDPRAQPSEPILFPRPDAVMSTTGRGRHSVLRIFKGRRGRTGHRATCGALPAAGPYLRLSLPFTWNLSPLRPSKFSFEYLLLPPRSAPTAAPPRLTPKVSAQFGTVTRLPGSSRIASSAYQKWPTWSSRFRGTAQRSSRANSHPGSSYPEGNFGGNQLLDGSISLSPLYPSQTNDLHVQYRCGPPPEFPLASPRSGIVHHLSGPDRHAHTRTLLRRSRSVGGAPR